MSGLYVNPCVPEQSSSTSNRYEKASHREWADMLGRIGTPVQGANMKGNSLGNRLRRKDILPPFRMFYSLGWRSSRLQNSSKIMTNLPPKRSKHCKDADVGNCPYAIPGVVLCPFRIIAPFPS